MDRKPVDTSDLAGRSPQELAEVRCDEGLRRTLERSCRGEIGIEGLPDGRLKGRPPKLSTAQEDLLRKLHGEGQHTIVQLAELFGVGRATVYRALERKRLHAQK
ncbi:helix-turn-helix domain-containing protein [Curtobacterium flaccumfaciens pv. oortii]|uniref:helix-turn-helix domain-containing protein n=1 Tax=Curtobacterium flaccumfaciens TaxID=2035 RepID=UPI0026595574|nr:helix-turn-helix domain-containing protein [Curtobacterium flaccumfaciens]MCS5524829.1 helix-turn-helix domain-containing protein [Curtobacterium flaccumfaciens pv. oortii]